MAKRKALGKGLSALIPDESIQESSDSGFFLCPVERITPNPSQPRQSFSPKELEEMSASVKEKGILTPLLVTGTEEGYQLIAGERRWRAAQKAGLDRVPVVIRDVTPAESLELALIENIHRKDLNPIEEAQAYSRLLKETGLTQENLAKRLGKERSAVTNLLRLLNLPTLIQQDVIEGRLHMGHARVLAGLSSRDEQKSLRDRIIKNGLSVRNAESFAQRSKKQSPSSVKAPVQDPYLRSIGDDLKRSLGTRVDITKKGNKGRIEIYFYSEEELDRLLELLS